MGTSSTTCWVCGWDAIFVLYLIGLNIDIDKDIYVILTINSQHDLSVDINGCWLNMCVVSQGYLMLS